MRRQAVTLPLQQGTILSDGFRQYEIINQLQAGRNGVTYLARTIGQHTNSKLLVIKHPIVPDGPISYVRERIKYVTDSFHNEYEAMKRLSESTYYETRVRRFVAPIVGTGVFTGHILVNGVLREIPYFPFIVQEFVAGQTLRSVIEDYCPRGIAKPTDWFHLARLAATAVGRIHDERIVHGDIHPGNIMVALRREDQTAVPGIDLCQVDGIVLIDFGKAWIVDEHMVKKPEGDAYAYRAPERVMMTAGYWAEPADIYALGGVLYFLASGKKPTTPFKNDSFDLKGNDEVKAWLLETCNTELISRQPSIIEIILLCLRPSAHERADHARTVLDTICQFENAFKPQAHRTSDDTAIQIRDVVKSVRTLSSQNPVMCSLIEREATALNRQIERVAHNLYRATGDRETLLSGLLAAFSSLQANDKCYALTTPQFWASQNFGHSGRFIEMIRMAALNHISIQWIIVCSAQELTNPHVRMVLSAQQRMVNALRQSENQSGRSILGRPDAICPTRSYFGYYVLPEIERNELVRRARTFIFLETDPNRIQSSTLIAPTFAPRGIGDHASRDDMNDELSIIRYWKDPVRWRDELFPTFVEILDKSRPTERYDNDDAIN